MKKRLLTVAIIVTFLIGTMSFAKEYEPVPTDEMMVIDAEDIGIREYAVGDDFVDEEYVPDEPEDDEEVIEDDVIESDEEFVDEPNEPEDIGDTKDEPVVETPEGTKEGYVSNTFYEPEKHTECEFVHCVTYDEDTNSYVFEEWCTVCGEGTGQILTEEEFESLCMDCDVEF